MEQNGVLAAAKELDAIVLAYSPLGRGFLTGRYKSPADFAEGGDFRGMLPRMQAEVWSVYHPSYPVVRMITEALREGNKITKSCTNSNEWPL